jgi:hypothetical protein
MLLLIMFALYTNFKIYLPKNFFIIIDYKADERIL